ncbi:hypothetical protein [Paenibacillus sp. CF384]|uniref:hypothetical protein n=1 Tax=Paenibacillus sp. CF384 TaxID=1884382 RepID=UPI000899D060|nr:hypothetical protein [Paenibacillus sp. CF384]SDW08597.1 hypothetical protein SAMN05518855_1001213 [Paenibacillus sp. CF384]
MAIDKIITAEMYSVTFVRDYVQFGFHCETDDACLTAWALPTVTMKGMKYRYGNIGYRDALCGLINQLVEVVLTGDEDLIKIIFEGKDELSIRPTDEEREILVEYAMFFYGNLLIEVWN